MSSRLQERLEVAAVVVSIAVLVLAVVGCIISSMNGGEMPPVSAISNTLGAWTMQVKWPVIGEWPLMGAYPANLAWTAIGAYPIG